MHHLSRTGSFQTRNAFQDDGEDDDDEDDDEEGEDDDDEDEEEDEDDEDGEDDEAEMEEMMKMIEAEAAKRNGKKRKGEDSKAVEPVKKCAASYCATCQDIQM